MSAHFDSWPSPHPPPSSAISSTKKPRHRHSPSQLAALNHLFDQNEHPPLEQRSALAEKLGMETKTVNAWFQNKRASSKKRIRTNPTLESQPLNPLPVPNHHHPSELDELHEDEYSSVDTAMHSRSASVVPSDPSSFYTPNSDHSQFYTDSDNMPRRMRMRPSNDQIDELRKLYNLNPHPTTEERQALAATIGMRYQSITNWFQNQRSLAKKRKEDEFDSYSAAPSKPDYYPHDMRQFSAFPPPSHIHPSLALPPSSSHPSLRPSSVRRSPSPPVEDRSPRRSSHHRGATPYGSMTTSFSRPRRSRPEPYQLEALKELFTKTSTPTIEERSALALEVGMDVGKVTNWFRNLRQTARKRAKKSGSGEDDDDDGRDLFSATLSRSGTPSPSSSSSINGDMEIDDYDMHHGLSDMGSEEEYQEAVTPPEQTPEPSQHSRNVSSRSDAVTQLTYRPELDTISLKQYAGIRIEDALLLLSFHQHIVH